MKKWEDKNMKYAANNMRQHILLSLHTLHHLLILFDVCGVRGLLEYRDMDHVVVFVSPALLVRKQIQCIVLSQVYS